MRREATSVRGGEGRREATSVRVAEGGDGGGGGGGERRRGGSRGETPVMVACGGRGSACVDHSGAVLLGLW